MFCIEKCLPPDRCVCVYEEENIFFLVLNTQTEGFGSDD